MPVLGEETTIYPENLLDGFGAEQPERQWWVLYTKARQEKSVARQLLGCRIPFYLPLVRKNLLYRGRKLQSHIPLFAGYVFLFGSEEERRRSLTTNRISRVLPVPNQAELYRDLSQVLRIIDSEADLAIEPRLAPGQRVRIRAGSLAGLEGTVVSRQRVSRLVVAVNFLRQGVSVEIDDFLLEPVD